MSTKTQKGLIIFGGVLSFLLAGLFFFVGESRTPRIVQMLTAGGMACFGMLIVAWGMKTPAWVHWCLFAATIAGLLSGDIYEVAAGQKHWLRLLPLPAVLLIVIFGKKRTDDAG